MYSGFCFMQSVLYFYCRRDAILALEAKKAAQQQ